MPLLPKTWITPIARAGYSARALVYLVIGGLALLAAAGSGKETDSEGAVRTLLGQPFGSAIVFLLAAGLAGYVAWRIAQAVFDADDHGTSPKGLVVRAVLLGSAAAYGSLALYAVSLLRAASSGPGEGSGGAVAGFVDRMFGNGTVAFALAVVFAGLAGAHLFNAWKQKYAEKFDAPESRMRLIVPVATTGLAARGAVFAVLAVLWAYRFATVSDPSGPPPGIDDALGFIQSLPLGGLLLAATGAGLVAFAAYSFLEAVWRKITVAG